MAGSVPLRKMASTRFICSLAANSAPRDPCTQWSGQRTCGRPPNAARSPGLLPGWLDAKLPWPAGCQSCVATTRSNRGCSSFAIGMTSSPRGTASAPPGRKSFWMSTRIRVRIACTMLQARLRFIEQHQRIDRQPGCRPTRHARGARNDHACGVTFPGGALMAGMPRTKRIGSALLSTAFLLTTATSTALAAEKTEAQDSAQQAPPKKHSKLKGAVVGGAGGAVVGGKKGAALGAAGGALYQHHKNKKEAKQQQKSQQ